MKICIKTNIFFCTETQSQSIYSALQSLPLQTELVHNFHDILTIRSNELSLIFAKHEGIRKSTGHCIKTVLSWTLCNSSDDSTWWGITKITVHMRTSLHFTTFHTKKLIWWEYRKFSLKLWTKILVKCVLSYSYFWIKVWISKQNVFAMSCIITREHFIR